jgi:hypothetical protein
MKPEDQITAYLFAHKATIQNSTVADVVKQVKLSVFYGFSTIPDDAIRKVVVQWATFNAVGMLLDPSSVGAPAAAGSGRPSRPTDSALIGAVTRAITTVSNGVTVGRKGANVNVGVTGLTANLKSGAASGSLGVSWTGTLKLQAESGPFHFEGTLSSDKWEITLSFPQDSYIPDLTTLGTVFTKGEKAVIKIAEATSTFQNLNDVRNLAALIKPHVDAAQDAVDALTGIAKAPQKGGPSFGFKIGSPEPGPGQQGMPGGFQATGVFTWVF